jgi:hypothetical protein
MNITKYNALSGVPRFHYYLKEITQFGDFEVSQEERILYSSPNKQDLIDLCHQNNWDCPDAKSGRSGWETHHILYCGVSAWSIND